MKKILIVDDHTMFRQALLAVLKDSAFQCDDVGTVEAAREKLAAKAYDVAILDISMPQVSGIDYLPELTSKYPKMPVLMLSMYGEEQFALQALRLGARGYMSKKEAADELFVALATLMEGGRYLSRTFSSTVVNQLLVKGAIEEPPHLRLSRREMEIFKRLIKGQSLKGIGEELDLSIKTISTYKTRLFVKMGFKNTASMISYALMNNIA